MGGACISLNLNERNRFFSYSPSYVFFVFYLHLFVQWIFIYAFTSLAGVTLKCLSFFILTLLNIVFQLKKPFSSTFNFTFFNVGLNFVFQ